MHGMHAWAYHYAGLQYWSKGDYVSAKINTRIYMGLMGEIAILSTSL